MVTFAAAAADSSARWIIIITIEGSGTSSGIYRYCSEVPTYAAGNALYRDWLLEEAWPDILSEAVDVLGGVPDSGAITAEIVDLDDSLTSEWRIDRTAETTLSDPGGISSSDTTIIFADATNLAQNDVVYIGSEAIVLGTKSVNTFSSCTRGALDTLATSHDDGLAVFRSINYLQGRRIRLYLVPKDGDSASDETQIGPAYHIDRYALGSGLNAWRLEASSDLRMLTRLIAGDTVVSYSARTVGDAYQLFIRPQNLPSRYVDPQNLFDDMDPWTEGEAYFKIGDEVIKTDTSLSPIILERGALGTKPGGAIDPEETAHIVFAADRNGPSPFRHSESNSTSRDHTWLKVEDPASIMLCILTSSAHVDDGLELTNGDATYGNFSGLPVTEGGGGYGLGIPASQIDFASFIDVRDRTANYAFPYFFIGGEPQQFAELVTEHFLKLLGAYLTTTGGKIALKLPSIPKQQDSATTWDTDVLLQEDGEGRLHSTTLLPEADTSHVHTTVIINTRGPAGETIPYTFTDADFEGWQVAKHYHSRTSAPLVVEAPSVRGGTAEADALAEDAAMRKLFRFRRPQWGLPAKTGIGQYARGPGDLVQITHDDLPDLQAGTRGWTSVYSQIVSGETRLGDNFTGIDWRLLGFGPGLKAGRIAPSARIHAVAGNVCTVSTDVYTDPNNQAGWSTPDSTDFDVSDVVRLLNPDGSEADSGTQIVSASSGNSITLDGNFSGNLAAELILVFAQHDDCVAAQTGEFVFYAARTDAPPNIQASTEEPWRYGEL